MSSPFSFGKIPVKVVRNKQGRPCFMFHPYDEDLRVVQLFVTIQPDGSYTQETLSIFAASARVYREVNGTPHRRPFTHTERLYWLQKFCNHYRMDMDCFMLVECFGKMDRPNENRLIMNAPRDGYHRKGKYFPHKKVYIVRMYGKDFTFQKYTDALEWCTAGIAECEGAERDRYADALVSLKSGWNFINTDSPTGGGNETGREEDCAVPVEAQHS